MPTVIVDVSLLCECSTDCHNDYIVDKISIEHDMMELVLVCAKCGQHVTYLNKIYYDDYSIQ